MAADWLCVLGQIAPPLWAEQTGYIRSQQSVAKSGPSSIFVKKVLL